jgi:hypothetical protein
MSVVSPGGFVREGPEPCPYSAELNYQAQVRDTGAWWLLMKMLLASVDLWALQPVAKQLVASGIPIALCKGSETGSYLEIWIQRESDSSLARELLPTRGVAPAAPPAGVKPPCTGRRGRSRVSRRGIFIVTSRIGFCIWWRRQLRRT